MSVENVFVSYYKPAKLIDFHAHIFPDDVAPKVMELFRTVNMYETIGDGTLASTLAWMEKAGVDICVAQPVATKPSQVKGINDWAHGIQSDRLISFGAMHPDFQEVKEEVARLVDMGFRGVKLQPGWQYFYPDEERVFPIYEACEGKLAILFHAGHELSKELTVRGLAPCFRTVHDKFPGLTMVVAHMGGYQGWEDAERNLFGTGVYLDTSYCPQDQLSDEEMIRMIRRHGVEKALFASDFPLRDPGEDAVRLANMDLTPNEKDDIAWRNAVRLLGI